MKIIRTLSTMKGAMEMENKKKPHTSAAVKNRYNKKNYKRYNILLRFEDAEKWDNYCSKNGISRPESIRQFLRSLN